MGSLNEAILHRRKLVAMYYKHQTEMATAIEANRQLADKLAVVTAERNG